jgi:hypothetical protein
MHRAALRRVVTAFAIVVVVSGSVTAQAAETQLAGGVLSTSAAAAVPPHTCTATRCLVTTSHHVAGGGPDAIIPAVLLAAGLLGGLGYKRLNAHDDATAPRPPSTKCRAEASNRPINLTRPPDTSTHCAPPLSRVAQRMHAVARRIKPKLI